MSVHSRLFRETLWPYRAIANHSELHSMVTESRVLDVKRSYDILYAVGPHSMCRQGLIEPQMCP